MKDLGLFLLGRRVFQHNFAKKARNVPVMKEMRKSHERSKASQNDVALSSLASLFIMRPHSDDLYCTRGRVNLVNETMLDVYPTRICAGEIAEEFLVWRRRLERIFRYDVEQSLRLKSKVC